MSNDFFNQSFTPPRNQGSISNSYNQSSRMNLQQPGSRNTIANASNKAAPRPPPPHRPNVSAKPLPPPVPRSQAVTTQSHSTDQKSENHSVPNNGNFNGNNGGKNPSNSVDYPAASAVQMSGISSNSKAPNNNNNNMKSWNAPSGGTLAARPTGNYYGIHSGTNNGSIGNSGIAVPNSGTDAGVGADADDWFTPAAAVPTTATQRETNGAYSYPSSSQNFIPAGSSYLNGNRNATAAGGTATSAPNYSMDSHSQPQRSDSMTELFSGSMSSGPMLSSSLSNSNISASFSNNNHQYHHHHQNSNMNRVASNGGSFGIGGGNAIDFLDEPPLLEELGINISHIRTKSLAVILPVRYAKAVIDTSIMEDNDMAGPLAFGLLLATELLLAGKIHFGYIYGFGLFGCLATTLVLNLMSPSDAISIWTVVSILGYSLLPVNVLAAINIFYRIKYMGSVGVVLAAVTIVWCTMSSTRLIERGCGMRDQRYLIGYPNALLYSAFVMLTIF